MSNHNLPLCWFCCITDCMRAGKWQRQGFLDVNVFISDKPQKGKFIMTGSSSGDDNAIDIVCSISASTDIAVTLKADANSLAALAFRSATATNASSWTRLRAKFSPHIPHPIRPIFAITQLSHTNTAALLTSSSVCLNTTRDSRQLLHFVTFSEGAWDKVKTSIKGSPFYCWHCFKCCFKHYVEPCC